MIPIQNIPFRRRHRKITSSPPPVVGPVLVGASFDDNLQQLELDFDRPVSVDGFYPYAVIVNDPGTGGMYQADVASLSGDSSVIISVEVIGASSGSQAWVTATGGAGIVATDDGSPWAGVMELALPFP